jgi:voltage-gated potassium channel
MFYVALLHLVLLSGLVHRIRTERGEGEKHQANPAHAAAEQAAPEAAAASEYGWMEKALQTREIQFILGALALLWPIFFIEGLARFLLRPPEQRGLKNLALALAPALFPPMRMAARGVTRPGAIWLPRTGWRQIDYDLQKDVERAFSPFMLVLALMIVPVLAIEYFWADQIRARPALRWALDIGVGIIWIAFVTEFVIRISIADSKLRYALSHWLDLAIVLLPMFEFMPALRLLRVARVMRIDVVLRMAKYYRLYGLAGKGWRAFVVLEVVQRILSRKPAAKLARLRSRLEDKEAEKRELEREIDYYRRKVEEAQQRFTDQEGRPPPKEEPAATDGLHARQRG